MEEINKKKLTPQKIGAILVAIISVNIASHYFSKPSAEKEIAELIAKTNKSLPEMVGSEIRLDSLTSKSNTLQYNCTFVNIEKQDLNVEDVKKELQEKVLHDLKTRQGLEAFKKNNITISYNYNDKNKENICKDTVTADQYK